MTIFFSRSIMVCPDQPLVGLVLLSLPHKDLDVVLHPTGLALLPTGGLYGDGGGGVGGHLEGEGKGVRAELLHQAFWEFECNFICYMCNN